MIISETDHRILAVLCKGYRIRGLGNKAVLADLTKKLREATVIPVEDVPPNVVTINSRVRVTELGSGISFICRVVLPWEADIERRRVSVLSGVGSALLGESAGQVVMCRSRERVLLISIEELVKQTSMARQLMTPVYV